MEVLDGVKVVWDFLFYGEKIGSYEWFLDSESGGENVEKMAKNPISRYRHINALTQ